MRITVSIPGKDIKVTSLTTGQSNKYMIAISADDELNPLKDNSPFPD